MLAEQPKANQATFALFVTLHTTTPKPHYKFILTPIQERSRCAHTGRTWDAVDNEEGEGMAAAAWVASLALRSSSSRFRFFSSSAFLSILYNQPFGGHTHTHHRTLGVNRTRRAGPSRCGALLGLRWAAQILCWPRSSLQTMCD